ncbi:hypothetical protein OSB04_020036 [Centaurea solstitialis]|uniref:Fe2OG dioxygenase domain-containing protein n=1 Tax=Centaurea solstitialis TaxID=347529 RepID=A0AA38TAZ5_9ASTR|nr:hypothetical protein OSB04_020036 [Centaurea solstitialis]
MPATGDDTCYDRQAELKAFDETKAGVKGLADAGIRELPRIFIHQPEPLPVSSTPFPIPIVDLGSPDRASTVEKIREASETLGFFQVVNHGIPVSVMDGVVEGVRRFHDQDVEVRKRFYTRDPSKPLVYHSNYDLYSSPAASWRDSFYSFMAPTPPPPEELPEVCRDLQIEYSNEVMKLGRVLFGLLSEALKLNTNHLEDMDLDKGLAFFGHCYPACPQPELTMGGPKHTDYGFLTVLLQDEIGGLQINYNNEWVDVPPTPGALVINIGDLLQVPVSSPGHHTFANGRHAMIYVSHDERGTGAIISNDKLKSVEHRVLANKKGPRVSVACFFSTSIAPLTRRFLVIPLDGLFSRLLGSGNGIKFWKEVWCDSKPLLDCFPRLAALDANQDCTIADRVKQTENGLIFTWNWRRTPRDGREIQMIKRIEERCERIPIGQGEEKWHWELDKDGVFSVASLRLAMDDMSLPRGGPRISENKSVPIKVKITSWRAARDSLPTKINLIRRGVALGDDLCPLCKYQPESVKHLFVECDRTKAARGAINNWWRVLATNANELNGILLGDDDEGSDNNKKLRLAKNAIFHAYIWAIWKGRNEVVFNGTSFNPLLIANLVQSETYFWVKNRCAFGKNLSWLEWRCNPESL